MVVTKSGTRTGLVVRNPFLHIHRRSWFGLSAIAHPSPRRTTCGPVNMLHPGSRHMFRARHPRIILSLRRGPALWTCFGQGYALPVQSYLISPKLWNPPQIIDRSFKSYGSRQQMMIVSVCTIEYFLQQFRSMYVLGG